MARAAAVVAVVLLAPAACGGGGDGEDADPTTTVATTPRSSTSAAETTESPPSTTETPTSSTTTSQPSVAAPVSVLLVGDSVGFTLQEHVPDGVPGVTSVDGKALAGCGLILDGERPPEAVAVGAPERYDDCAIAVHDNDRDGLAADPDVVLLVSGAWERSDHVRDGRTVGPGDADWAEQIRGLLTDRVEELGSTGATVALWADPCAPEPQKRVRQDWYRDDVLAPVADATAAVLIDPAPVACAADGTPLTDVPGIGDPRPDDGQHWSEQGAAWLWTTWLGPALSAATA